MREGYTAAILHEALMTDWNSPARLSGLSRRRLLRSALGAALGVAPALAAAPQPARLTQQEALYQGEPKDMQTCAMCTLFLPPGACKVVEGAISANGWCRLFDMAD